jgi:hypothetical protein
MSSIDWDWINNQLDRARIQPTARDLITDLLDFWEGVEVSDDVAANALDVFRELAQGHSLLPTNDNGEETWVAVQRGTVVVGNEVRVKHDAFTGQAGTLHNGRRGKVVGIRYGDIIVRSTDGVEPFLDGTHYAPDKLERRIR